MGVEPGSPIFAAFSVALLVLIAKAQILSAATSLTRGKLKKFITEEDAEWLGGERAYPDDTRVFRVFRAHQNDLEALLPFFVVGSLYVASGASAVAGMIYFLLFVLARMGHSFAYLTKRPELRRNSYALGWLAIFVIGGHALWAVFQS